ncbi:MAG: hypothetical protein A3K77_01470 [Euryarchaeota archaeon RBG_13_31_8]|nr:MAG: hypothetical protein A3K77_01470 [Euryarchaeota archaeon RBG_13_31_8]
MKKKIFVICTGFIAILGILSGCIKQTEETGAQVQENLAPTEIRIKDKPTSENFDHLNVTFSEIKLHKSGDNDSEWINISLENITIDLLYLHLNNLTEQLNLTYLELGDYDKLWINVSNATGVLNETGEIKNITIPSGWLKIQQLHLFNITKGNNTITVDIDLENSLHAYAGGTEYKLTPVISGIEHHHENRLINKHDKSENIAINQSPIIEIVANGSRGKSMTINVDVWENITFNASETFDPDGDELSYFWDFGDGNNSTNVTVEHGYEDRGTYNVKLTVSDGFSESTEEIHVNVKEKGGPF